KVFCFILFFSSGLFHLGYLTHHNSLPASCGYSPCISPIQNLRENRKHNTRTKEKNVYIALTALKSPCDRDCSPSRIRSTQPRRRYAAQGTRRTKSIHNKMRKKTNQKKTSPPGRALPLFFF
ncbi:unnamed protein product, partial [Sphacelaria rigidula]